MDNKLLKSQKDIDAAIGNLRQLKSTAGWQLLVQIVQANMRVLEEQILNGVEGATEDDMNRKRDKLKAYKEVIETPDFIIHRYDEPAEYQDESDPYHTVDSLKDMRAREDARARQGSK